jgi:hypothetical protein
MYIGKSIIQGVQFVVVPYRDVLKMKNTKVSSSGTSLGTGYMNFKGKDVSLEGLSNSLGDGTFPSTNQNYTNAMSDFDTVINNYPNEVEKANSIQTFGEAALYEEIKLTDTLGMKTKLVGLCKEFVQNYPNSNFPLSICTNVLKLSSRDVAVKEITVN